MPAKLPTKEHRYFSEFREAVMVDNLEPVHQICVRQQLAMARRVLRQLQFLCVNGQWAATELVTLNIRPPAPSPLLLPFWQAPLGVRSAIHRHQPPHRTVLGQGPDLQNILRLSYEYAKITIDLRRTSNLQNILRRMQDFLGTIYLQRSSDSVCELAYDIPKRNFSTS